jgi:hypothetical protein
MIELREGGAGHAHVREGWGPIGAADTWTIARRARVELPTPAPDAHHLLAFHVEGIFAPHGLDTQRVIAIVNGVRVGEVVCHSAGRFELLVAAQIARRRDPVEIVFELPDASPARAVEEGPGGRLGVRMSRLGLTPAVAGERAGPAGGRVGLPALHRQRQALMRMQSLGVNCEFGFLQRSVGAEPLGLLRWTHAPLDKLLAGLADEFFGLTRRDDVDVSMTEAGEFIVKDRAYGLEHHSFLFASKGGTAAEVLRMERLRVGLTRRSLLEELRGRRTLFVFHDADGSSVHDVRRLVNALNRYGTNTLLWLVGATAGTRLGSARWLEPGMIQGYVSGFQYERARVSPLSEHRPSWLAAACDAYGLWRTAALRARPRASRAGPGRRLVPVPPAP